MNHLYLSQLIFNRPLLISEAKLNTILGVLGPRFEGRVLPRIESDQAVTIGRTEEPTPDESVAMIPILGSLVNRAFGIDALSGLQSYHEIRDQLRMAVNDDSVKGIILDIDSPGGEVSGAFGLAQAIREASQVKPVMALIDENGFSAAYALASAATRVVVPRTGAVGSIGVLAVHMDQSEKDKQDGLKFTFVKAGKHKDDLNPHEPLASDARERLQAEVNRIYDIFVNTVAEYRGLSVEHIRSTEAGIFFGEEAKDIGLVDAIQSRDESLGMFIEEVAKRTPRVEGHTFIETEKGEISMSNSHVVKPNQINNDATNSMTAGQGSNPPATQPDKTKVEIPTPVKPEAQAGQTLPNATDQVSASYVAEVMQLCEHEGKLHLASQFIQKKIGVEQVRTSLIDARAEEDQATEIVSQPPVEASVSSSAKMEPIDDVYDRFKAQMFGQG